MNWDQYFLNIAEAVSKKSHCISVKRGCVLVKDNQILSSGYNGPPRGYPNCDEIYPECPKKSMGFKSGTGQEFCPASHAETNAIVQAARNGVKIKGSKVYCNFKQIPCRECSKLIVNAGIIEIILNDKPVVYQEVGLKGIDILRECQIKCVEGDK